MKIVIIGSGSAAIAAADIIVQDRNLSIAGFIGTKKEESKLMGQKIYENLTFLGHGSLLRKLKDEGITGFIVAIGDNYIREKRFYEASLEGFTPVNAISRSALIEPTVKIGKGVIINSGCIVSHGVSIGDNTCLDAGVIIEIKTFIGENCYLCSGSIVGGMCEIQRNVVLEHRSTIKSYTVIGKNNTIKAGQLVKVNVKDKPRNK